MTASIYCILEIRVVGKSSWKEREVGNFAWLFPTSAKLSNFRLSNFSFFPTVLSNYTHPASSHINY